MTGRRGRERLGGVLAVVVAVLLASVIVALARTADGLDAMDASQKPVEIELNLPEPIRMAAMPAPISPDSGAGDALKILAVEENCLAQVIYFEARGESEAGRRAVAEVILNRLAEGGHGHTICHVVYEGADQTFCQFTFACDGALRQPRQAESWRAAQVLAARLLAGEVPAGNLMRATYYHAVSVHPTWAPEKLRVAQIGNHIFYRERPAELGTVFRGSMQ